MNPTDSPLSGLLPDRLQSLFDGECHYSFLRTMLTRDWLSENQPELLDALTSFISQSSLR
jgi:hypothetical protein